MNLPTRNVIAQAVTDSSVPRTVGLWITGAGPWTSHGKFVDSGEQVTAAVHNRPTPCPRPGKHAGNPQAPQPRLRLLSSYMYICINIQLKQYDPEEVLNKNCLPFSMRSLSHIFFSKTIQNFNLCTQERHSILRNFNLCTRQGFPFSLRKRPSSALPDLFIRSVD